MKLARVLVAALILVPAGLYAADPAVTAPSPLLKPGDRIAIIGDSITEQKLYSVMIETYLRACTPELKIKALQLGWAGERAGGFAERMENDCMFWKPTVATLCYGMNDGCYGLYTEAIGALYRTNMTRIADRFAKAGMRVVVGTPGVVDSFTWRQDKPDDDKIYNANLATLGGIGRDIASARGFAFADVHATMMNSMTNAKAALGDAYPVAGGDGVHPGPNGQLCMAYAFLKSLGLDGKIGEISLAWPDQAKASAGHTVKSATNGCLEIESLRYPFCFTGSTNDPNGTASILPFLPFNRDLNRLTLVVKGLSTPQAEVKWGAETRTFTREQLAAGVNLAAEFLNNPFSEPFRAVTTAVSAKQVNETRLVKGFLSILRHADLLEDSKDTEFHAALGVMRSRIASQLDNGEMKMESLVKPVTHKIQITPKA